MSPAAQGGHVCFAEGALTTPSVERVGRARPIFDAGVDEFLLKGGEEGQPGFAFQRAQRSPEEIARAAFPMRPVQGHDIGEIEALGRVLAELDFDFRARIGPQHQIALSAEWGLVDRPERRHHDVAVGQSDPVAQAGRQIGRREPLAANQPGEVARAEEDERFALHGRSPQKNRSSIYAHDPEDAMKPRNLWFVLPDEHSPRVVASAARAGQQIKGYVHQIGFWELASSRSTAERLPGRKVNLPAKSPNFAPN